MIIGPGYISRTLQPAVVRTRYGWGPVQDGFFLERFGTGAGVTDPLLLLYGYRDIRLPPWERPKPAFELPEDLLESS